MQWLNYHNHTGTNKAAPSVPVSTRAADPATCKQVAEHMEGALFSLQGGCQEHFAVRETVKTRAAGKGNSNYGSRGDLAGVY